MGLKLLSRWESFWARVFPTKNLPDIIQEHAAEAEHEAQQCRRVIIAHEYQEHMAKARLEAIEAWRRKRQGFSLSLPPLPSLEASE